MKADELQKHTYATYVSLRFGLAAIAIFFPPLLYVVGWFQGIPPQRSMSEYYWATSLSSSSGDPSMRVWFVGLLFAISVCLILYRGFSMKENLLLNLAGGSGIGVAAFPMPFGCKDCLPISLHYTCAVLLFLCIAMVSIVCAKETLHMIQDEKLRKTYLLKYRAIGAAMVLCPVIAFVFTWFPNAAANYVFFVEATGIYVFGYYWWTKSEELTRSQAEFLALQGRVGTREGTPGRLRTSPDEVSTRTGI